MWNAEQYLQFSDERARPFADLLSRVRGQPRFVVDLGCGPGNLTRSLLERWPDARVVGVDNSPEMLSEARAQAVAGRLEFVQADISSWSPESPPDLIVSNAALQWVSGHDALLGRLAAVLSPSGTLAVQMPYHFQNPAHLAIEAVKADPRWGEALRGVGLDQQSVMPVTRYVELLLSRGLTVDAWHTEYIHVLSGADPVLQWYKGTALRPLLAALDSQQASDFLLELGGRLRAAFPPHGDVTLLPFPRLFFVAARR